MNFEKLLKDHFKSRKINNSNIISILKNVCRDYKLGKLINFSKKVFGYQVLNLSFETTQAKFFTKIFPTYSKKESQNYVNLMLRIIKEGISYPKLLKNNQGFLYTVKVNENNYYLCVQEYIDGKNYYELRSDPNLEEIKDIARQAAKINSINYQPKYYEEDTWATRCLLEQYPIKIKGLTIQEIGLIEPIVNEFKKINLERLPHSFTHGDLIHTNVMKNKNGKIWIVDFGVAAFQPRIMELSILFHDLLIDLNNKNVTEMKRKIALDEYQKIIKLTSEEIRLLPILTMATHAIYLLSSAYMKRVLKENSEENDFWYTRSKKALELSI